MEKFDNLVTLLVLVGLAITILPAWLKGCVRLIEMF